jgi:hypothetical protein
VNHKLQRQLDGLKRHKISTIAKLEDEISRIQYHLSHPLTSTDNIENHMMVVQRNRKEIARLKGE